MLCSYAVNAPKKKIVISASPTTSNRKSFKMFFKQLIFLQLLVTLLQNWCRKRWISIFKKTTGDCYLTVLMIVSIGVIIRSTVTADGCSYWRSILGAGRFGSDHYWCKTEKDNSNLKPVTHVRIFIYLSNKVMI